MGRRGPVDWRDVMLKDPWRPKDWGDKLTAFEENIAQEMEKTLERSAKVVGDINRRIDEDIALLLRAGVSFHRIKIARDTSSPLTLRDPAKSTITQRLLVDGETVQTYE